MFYIQIFVNFPANFLIFPPGGQRQQLSYDTQFKVGNYYASMLTMRDVRMKSRESGAPMILPAFMVLHDRKFKEDHALAFDFMIRAIPEMKTKRFLATSDQEFLWLLELKLLKSTVGVCENHLTKSLGHWVKEKIGQSSVSFYKNEFRTLIREQTREEYDLKLIERRARWHPKFADYWHEFIAPLVDKVSLWKAKEIQWGGLTSNCIWSSNQSESFNHILRHKLNYQEVEMSECFHVFRDIQRAVLMETAR